MGISDFVVLEIDGMEKTVLTTLQSRTGQYLQTIKTVKIRLMSRLFRQYSYTVSLNVLTAIKTQTLIIVKKEHNQQIAKAEWIIEARDKD